MQITLDDQEKEFLSELLSEEHDFKEKLLKKLGAKEKFA